MIESRLTYRFIYMILTIFVFINIFILGICTDSYEWNHQTHYEFNYEGFLKANVFVLILCGVIFMISMNRKFHIIIEGEKIRVRKYLSNHVVEFDLSEISKFEWKRLNSSMSLGRALTMARSTNNLIMLTFDDESELLISNYDYKNYEELRDLLYAYCKKKGIIKDTTAQIRRRKELMGR